MGCSGPMCPGRILVYRVSQEGQVERHSAYCMAFVSFALFVAIHQRVRPDDCPRNGLPRVFHPGVVSHVRKRNWQQRTQNSEKERFFGDLRGGVQHWPVDVYAARKSSTRRSRREKSCVQFPALALALVPGKAQSWSSRQTRLRSATMASSSLSPLIWIWTRWEGGASSGLEKKMSMVKFA